MDEVSDLETVWDMLLLVFPQWQTAHSATQSVGSVGGHRTLPQQLVCGGVGVGRSLREELEGRA